MNTYFLGHLEQLPVLLRNGDLSGVSDGVERVAGRSPKSLETFVRENITAFTAA